MKEGRNLAKQLREVLASPFWAMGAMLTLTSAAFFAVSDAIAGVENDWANK